MPLHQSPGIILEGYSTTLPAAIHSHKPKTNEYWQTDLSTLIAVPGLLQYIMLKKATSKRENISSYNISEQEQSWIKSSRSNIDQMLRLVLKYIS